jgi:hypothetical protein
LDWGILVKMLPLNYKTETEIADTSKKVSEEDKFSKRLHSNVH